jgi:hypothetical protein
VTVHRHDDTAAHPVSVDELIERVRSEGLPVRLAWRERTACADDGPDGWPTGELPRITEHFLTGDAHGAASS